ncbi:hypothetical protein PoB_007416100 [Plakobranchus ocellatus]|uniref:Uncharacterized protein n=1 Tax=Plakobranchus ocellatus TaxID=259542 RepID=A0AAV4DUZ5_9GAST|nr:hypothetical protein PoB_007416100 [Plakobranchus ocellatus]
MRKGNQLGVLEVYVCAHSFANLKKSFAPSSSRSNIKDNHTDDDDDDDNDDDDNEKKKNFIRSNEFVVTVHCFCSHLFDRKDPSMKFST